MWLFGYRILSPTSRFTRISTPIRLLMWLFGYRILSPRFKLCTERVGEVYTHTHLLYGNFCAALTLRVNFAHSHACHTHAWLKDVRSAHVVISLSSHLLPSHVSPILAPAVPWRSLREHSRPRPHRLWRPRFPAELSRPESAGQAHSARGRAVWLSGQVRAQQRLWAQKVRQEYFRRWWRNAHQRSGPQFLWLLENHEREH